MTKITKFIYTLIIVLLLVFFTNIQPINATIGDDPLLPPHVEGGQPAVYVAKLGIHSCIADNNTSSIQLSFSFSSDFFYFFTSNIVGIHTFLTIENISQTSYDVGEYYLASNETISLGTYGNNENHNGILYNYELYQLKDTDNGDNLCSKFIYLSSYDLAMMNSYISTHDTWSYSYNCSNFAVDIWNICSSIDLNPDLMFDNLSNGYMTPKNVYYEMQELVPYTLGEDFFIVNNYYYYDGNSLITLPITE